MSGDNISLRSLLSSAGDNYSDNYSIQSLLTTEIEGYIEQNYEGLKYIEMMDVDDEIPVPLNANLESFDASQCFNEDDEDEYGNYSNEAGCSKPEMRRESLDDTSLMAQSILSASEFSTGSAFSKLSLSGVGTDTARKGSTILEEADAWMGDSASISESEIANVLHNMAEPDPGRRNSLESEMSLGSLGSLPSRSRSNLQRSYGCISLDTE